MSQINTSKVLALSVLVLIRTEFLTVCELGALNGEDG